MSDTQELREKFSEEILFFDTEGEAFTVPVYLLIGDFWVVRRVGHA